MNRITFTLKQHTPIIHFQHDQHGATLRATELKPKLDRFIIKKFQEQNIKYSDWLISGQEAALDYKVKVTPVEKSSYFVPCAYVSKKDDNHIKLPKTLTKKLGVPITLIAPSPYFANEDKIAKERWDEVIVAVISNDTLELEDKSKIRECISLEIKGFHKELLLKVKEYLPDFFITTNFGSRQSKGFGSFSVVAIDNKSFRINYNNCFKCNGFNTIKITKIYQSSIEIFKTINSVYKNIKCNSQDNRSSIRDFLGEDGLKWEKSIVKSNLINNKKEDVIPTKHKYIRAMLGLAESYNYPKDYDKKVKIKDESEKIERYKSPLLFKVIDGTIYIIAKEVDNQMLDKTFLFSESNNSNKYLKIKTPESFSMAEFFEYLAKEGSNMTLINTQI